ncbi:MAG: VOC family protein [Chloroflexi bacterium]|nr:VOC family protein [Chloroflexota bacterium]
MLTRFAYHGLTVADLDRSVAFYRDLLHMPLEKTYQVAGEDLERATGYSGAHIRVALLRNQGRLLKLTEFLSPQGNKKLKIRINDAGASHLTVQVENVHKAYEELLAKGVKFMSQPVRANPVARPDRYFTYMLDPDGIILQLSLAGGDGVGTYHHSHLVGDEAKAMAFYRDVLGMKTGRIRDITGPGISEAMALPDVLERESDLLVGDEAIEFQYFMRPKGNKKNEIRLCDVGCCCVAFEVDDIRRAYGELSGKGVTFVSPPVHLEEEGPGVTMAYLLDPDGYVRELRSGDPK